MPPTDDRGLEEAVIRGSKELGISVTSTEDVEGAVREADIIVTASCSPDSAPPYPPWTAPRFGSTHAA